MDVEGWSEEGAEAGAEGGVAWDYRAEAQGLGEEDEEEGDDCVDRGAEGEDGDWD